MGLMGLMAPSKAAAAHWLIKSEPYKYPYAQLEKDGMAVWDGIRNYEARNNLRAMRVGDLALYYHSNEGKEIVGVARVTRTAYQEPDCDENWSVVEFEPVMALPAPVTLAAIREHAMLGQMEMMRRNRLSVTHVSPEEYACILALGGVNTRSPARAKKSSPSAARTK